MLEHILEILEHAAGLINLFAVGVIVVGFVYTGPEVRMDLSS